MNKLNQQGFSLAESLLVIIIIAILGFAGWFVYSSQKSTNKTLLNTNKSQLSSQAVIVKDFAGCKKAAGSNILQTYPPQCITKAGKTFTDTSYHSDNSTADSNQKSLAIKEWGIKVSFEDAAKVTYDSPTDCSGDYGIEGSADCINLLLKSSVTTVEACKEIGVSIMRADKSNDPGSRWIIGNYSYSMHGGPGACMDGVPDSQQPSALNQLRAKITSIELGAAIFSALG
ncbi:MAG: prepilin-type N-terminal cleavage/methylation domain-containing protein [Candidatus Saccharimonadales bacterium]